MSLPDIIFSLAIAVVIAINLYAGPRIPRPHIAMQWGVDGKPTWTAPKQLALWGMVVVMLAVRAAIWLASPYAPQTVHGIDIGVIGFALIAAAAHVYVVAKALAE